jgi:hypothetical protein
MIDHLSLKNVIAPVARILTTINTVYLNLTFLVLRRSIQLSKIIILIFR